jgi:cardiolipin synthase
VNVPTEVAQWIGWGAAGVHLLGILSAFRAIMTARSSQGATAWAVGLVSMPYVALPLYWVFGRDRFADYAEERRRLDRRVSSRRQRPSSDAGPRRVLESLAGLPFTAGNEATLLIDGEATFAAIFAAIAEARHYVLVQFFIVRDDELGRKLRDVLVAASRRGVRVYFLYDSIGSRSMTRRYLRHLRGANVAIHPFRNDKGLRQRFQLNFRNHRKIVVVDGAVAFVGGHNVGDEYVGKSRRFGHWRDTHVRVSGPVVAQIEACFLEDWHWTTGTVPPLELPAPAAVSGSIEALAIPSGPADELDTCCLAFLEAIHGARRRLWIASPYFVPDAQVLSALQLAAMRGVDVRILLPAVADHLFVWLASFSYLKDTLPRGIRLFRYRDGFLHQKVLLADERLSMVGTANFDNRSFRLNFEITLVFDDAGFGRFVEAMLIRDFERSTPVTMAEIENRSYAFELAVRFARLLAPVL